MEKVERKLRELIENEFSSVDSVDSAELNQIIVKAYQDLVPYAAKLKLNMPVEEFEKRFIDVKFVIKNEINSRTYSYDNWQTFYIDFNYGLLIFLYKMITLFVYGIDTDINNKYFYKKSAITWGEFVSLSEKLLSAYHNGSLIDEESLNIDLFSDTQKKLVAAFLYNCIAFAVAHEMGHIICSLSPLMSEMGPGTIILRGSLASFSELHTAKGKKMLADWVNELNADGHGAGLLSFHNYKIETGEQLENKALLRFQEHNASHEITQSSIELFFIVLNMLEKYYQLQFKSEPIMGDHPPSYLRLKVKRWSGRIAQPNCYGDKLEQLSYDVLSKIFRTSRWSLVERPLRNVDDYVLRKIKHLGFEVKCSQSTYGLSSYCPEIINYYYGLQPLSLVNADKNFDLASKAQRLHDLFLVIKCKALSKIQNKDIDHITELLHLRVNESKKLGLGSFENDMILMFVVLQDESTTIIGCVFGTVCFLEDMRKEINKIFEAINFLISIKERGVFDIFPVKTVYLRYDHTLNIPLIDIEKIFMGYNRDSNHLHYQIIRDTHPNYSAEHYAELGRSLFKISKSPSDYKLVIETFMLAHKLYKKDDAVTCMLIAEAYYKLGEYNETITWCDKVDLKVWNDSLPLRLKGICKAILTNNFEGEDDLLAAAQMYPTEPDVYYDLACFYSRRREGSKALENLEKSIDLGYSDINELENDEELSFLRSYPGFMFIKKKLVSPLTSEKSKDKA